MCDLLKAFLIIKNVEKDLKYGNNFGNKIIDYLSLIFKEANVKQAYIVGGFSRDLLLRGSWYEIENQFHEKGKDIDVWLDFLNKNRFINFLTNNKRKEIEIINIDKYKIQIFISFFEENKKIKIDIGSYNYKNCNIRGSSIAYDVLNKKYKKDLFTLNLIYNILVKKVADLGKAHLGLGTGDPNDYYTDNIFDILHFSEQYNLPISKKSIENIKKIDQSLNINNNDLYVNRILTRCINIQRRKNILINRTGKLLSFIDYYDLKNYKILIKNILNKMIETKIESSAIDIDLGHYEIIQKNNIFYNDYDFINFCRNKDFNNTIFFYMSARGVLSNLLEVGYHNGNEWEIFRYSFNPENDNIRIDIKDCNITIFLNEDELNCFYYGNPFYFLNKDIKRNNDFGCIFKAEVVND